MAVPFVWMRQVRVDVQGEVLAHVHEVAGSVDPEEEVDVATPEVRTKFPQTHLGLSSLISSSMFILLSIRIDFGGGGYSGDRSYGDRSYGDRGFGGGERSFGGSGGYRSGGYSSGGYRENR